MSALPQPTAQAPAWLTQPTLQSALIERIRSGASVDEVREYYRFMREIQADEAKRLAAIDWVAVQAKLPAVPRLGKTPHYDYAKWNDYNAVLKPILSQHNYGLYFLIVRETATEMEVQAILEHTSGHMRSTSRTLPIDKTGSKNVVQAMGSTQSYGQRYAAIALLNLVSYDDNDAADAKGAPEKVSTEQIEQLLKSLEWANASEESFCRIFAIEQVKDLPAAQFKSALKRLSEYKEREDAKQEKKDATHG